MGIKDELRSALQVEDFPSSTLLSRAMARLDQPTPRLRRWGALAGVAGVLLLGISVGFIRFAHLLPIQPVNHRPPVSLSSAQEGLVSYRFVSPQVGWVTVFKPDGRTVIARTSDAGKHWERKLEIDGLAPSTPAKFFSASVALILGQQQGIAQHGSQATTFPITVWITTDGGAHWQVRPAPPEVGYLISADFLDATHGWLLTRTIDTSSTAQGWKVFVYETQDGAEHWTRVGGSENSTALAGPDAKLGVKFVTQTTGWITSFNASEGGRLYVTRDSGRGWQLQSLPPTGDGAPSSRVSIDLPTFLNPQEGVVVVHAMQSTPSACSSPGSAGTTSPGASCRTVVVSFASSTHDGGRSWSIPRQIRANVTLALVDSRRWIVVGADGISTSEDAGAAWSAPQPLPIPSGWAPIAAEPLDRDHVWIAIWDEPAFPARFITVFGQGSSSSGPVNMRIEGTPPRFDLIATIDGGAHWSEVSLGGLD